jgi:hypothetical protein
MGKLRFGRQTHAGLPENIFCFSFYSFPKAVIDSEDDYGADEHPSVKAYSNMLKAVASFSSDQDERKKISTVTLVGDSLAELLDNPSAPGSKGLERVYRQRARKNYSSTNQVSVLEMYKKWFGCRANEFVVARMNNEMDKVEEILKATVADIESCLKAVAKAHQKPLKFISIDPGRQYTGSFKPIDAPASEWYPKDLYRVTRVGLVEHEMVFLMKCLFQAFPKDLRNLLVKGYIIPTVARATMDKFYEN